MDTETQTTDQQNNSLDISTTLDEVGIVKANDSEKYDYYLIDADGHKLPVWPEEIESYESLLDEFKRETGQLDEPYEGLYEDLVSETVDRAIQLIRGNPSEPAGAKLRAAVRGMLRRERERVAVLESEDVTLEEVGAWRERVGEWTEQSVSEALAHEQLLIAVRRRLNEHPEVNVA